MTDRAGGRWSYAAASFFLPACSSAYLGGQPDAAKLYLPGLRRRCRHPQLPPPRQQNGGSEQPQPPPLPRILHPCQDMTARPVFHRPCIQEYMPISPWPRLCPTACVPARAKQAPTSGRSSLAAVSGSWMGRCVPMVFPGGWWSPGRADCEAGQSRGVQRGNGSYPARIKRWPAIKIQRPQPPGQPHPHPHQGMKTGAGQTGSPWAFLRGWSATVFWWSVRSQARVM